MSDEAQYAVVLRTFDAIDPEKLETMLRTDGGLARADASRAAHRASGILWERFSAKQATSIAGQLTKLGYAVRVIESAELPKLLRPRIVHWLELTDESMKIPWKNNQTMIEISWPSMFVIAAGSVGEIVQKRAEFQRRVLIPKVALESDHRASKQTLVADLIGIAGAGVMVHFRLPMNGLAYDRILGEKAEMESIRERFLTLLDKIVARSTSAVVHPDVKELVNQLGQTPEPEQNEAWRHYQERELEQQKRWLLMMAVFSELDEQES